MAIIYGMADSERNLLDKLPNEVKNVEDMDSVRKEFYRKMKMHTVEKNISITNYIIKLLEKDLK